MTETVRDHFGIDTACWREFGGCTTFHAVHVHVDFTPHVAGNPLPKCKGGSGGFDSPGSPALKAFEAEVKRRFPDRVTYVLGCRPIENTDPPQWSQHAYWNAIDVMTPTVEIGRVVWDWVNGPWTPPGGEDVDEATVRKIAQEVVLEVLGVGAAADAQTFEWVARGIFDARRKATRPVPDKFKTAYQYGLDAGRLVPLA